MVDTLDIIYKKNSIEAFYKKLMMHVCTCACTHTHTLQTNRLISFYNTNKVMCWS